MDNKICNKNKIISCTPIFQQIITVCYISAYFITILCRC